uniref:Cytochrome c oxidase subunit 7A1, mitochondrial n=1 Tax=Labrus bergylta TaxID=56723 RepID=A0A3Q3FNN6_9LABR
QRHIYTGWTGFLIYLFPILASRAFSSSARQLRNKVPEAQKIFQADNGLPVHIKGGTGDMLLYWATMTLTLTEEINYNSLIIPKRN